MFAEFDKRGLWRLLDEVIANQSPDNLDELENLLIYRCQKRMKQQELIKGLTCYHWWAKTRDVIYN
ncbi:hypothetical protein [Cyanobacterium sp. Dongsha4]|uniref:hypothetical protein n=1 Tax=Cyanobacterium sp. DS4 TaxID=2878255 RepID=UPI002E7FCE90|nr:hypothetical protein [Cyanobacterium sp. Dongsha4]WVK99166.1 hypothetical protein Dongsha4_10710 [Cyanobacterium sp. Dongsha4]